MPVSEFVLPDKAKKLHYHGHSQRLQERFQKGYPESLPDYGLLELILFGALRQGDFKPLAKRLIEQFDTLAGVLSADVDALQAADLGETTIVTLKVTQAAAKPLHIVLLNHWIITRREEASFTAVGC